VPLTAEEDGETLAAIDRGLKGADEGRTVSVEEVREMISQWIAKSASPKTR
jgi:predicted transcriptional regulator